MRTIAFSLVAIVVIELAASGQASVRSVSFSAGECAVQKFGEQTMAVRALSFLNRAPRKQKFHMFRFLARRGLPDYALVDGLPDLLSSDDHVSWWASLSRMFSRTGKAGGGVSPLPEERLYEAQSQVRQADKAREKRQWAKATRIYFDVIPLLRQLATQRRLDIAVIARHWLVQASEGNHVAGIHLADEEKLQETVASLKKMARLKMNGSAPDIRVEERELLAERLYSVQDEHESAVVLYRKQQLEEALPIVVIAVQSLDSRDSTFGRIFVLDGHHRAMAAFELGIPIRTFVIRVPSVVAEVYADTARRLFNGTMRTIPEVPVVDSGQPVPLKKAIAGMENLLTAHDENKQATIPLLEGFERRGRFVTWEDIRDFLPALKAEAAKRRPKLRAFVLDDGRFRLFNLTGWSPVELKQIAPGLLSDRMVNAIVQDLRVRDGKVVRFEDLSMIRGSVPGSMPDAFIIRARGSKRMYRIRTTNTRFPEIEIERATIAHALHLGPPLIYAELLGRARAGVIIQEFFQNSVKLSQRGKSLTRLEQRHVGVALANKVFAMTDDRRPYRMFHLFRNLPEDMFLLGSGRQIRVRFSNWPLSAHLANAPRLNLLLYQLQRLIPAVYRFMSPLVLASFLEHMKVIVGDRSDAKADFATAFETIRAHFTSKGNGYRIFFSEVDSEGSRLAQKSSSNPQRYRQWIWPGHLVIGALLAIPSTPPSADFRWVHQAV